MAAYQINSDDLEVGKPYYNMPTNKQEFEEVFPLLVQDLTNHCVQYGLPETALVWFRNVRVHLTVPLRPATALRTLNGSGDGFSNMSTALEPQSQHSRRQIKPRYVRC